MLVIILSVLLFIIFNILSGFHFYWMFGGTYAVKKVIPTKSNAPNTLAIPKFATLIVALVLLGFGLLYLVKSGLIHLPMPQWASYGYYIIPALFALRTIGEFTYVGMFKRIKDTEFAKADTRVFVPLCATIASIGLIIVFLDTP